MFGTCFTSGECQDKGGTADGNCAAGFGVCCLFLISDCDGTVTQNCTYVQVSYLFRKIILARVM